MFSLYSHKAFTLSWVLFCDFQRDLFIIVVCVCVEGCSCQYVCMLAYMSVLVIHAHMCVCLCTCVGGVYMPMCVHMCVFCWGVYMPMHVHACVCACGGCICLCVHACVCVWGSIHVRVCACLCMCMAGSGSEDDFMELHLSLLYVSSSFGAWVTRLVSKVPFSAWPFHNPKLDVIFFQMIIQKHRFFYPFVSPFVKMGFDFLGRKGI